MKDRDDFAKLQISKLTPKEKILKLAEINCTEKKCTHCCEFGSGYLLPEDIPRIAKYLHLNEEEFKKTHLETVTLFNTRLYRPKTENNGKPYGKCIFLNSEEGCTIHGIKPFHCKVGSCNEYGEQISRWFMLNYAVNPNDPESIRQWAVYLKTHPTIPGGNLLDIVPDEEKLKKILDYEDIKQKTLR